MNSIKRTLLALLSLTSVAFFFAAWQTAPGLTPHRTVVPVAPAVVQQAIRPSPRMVGLAAQEVIAAIKEPSVEALEPTAPLPLPQIVTVKGQHRREVSIADLARLLDAAREAKQSGQTQEAGRAGRP